MVEYEARGVGVSNEATPDDVPESLVPLIESYSGMLRHLTEATDRAARAEVKATFLSAQVAELERRLLAAKGKRPAVEGPPAVEAWPAAPFRPEPPPPPEPEPEASDPVPLEDAVAQLDFPSPPPPDTTDDDELPEGWRWPDEAGPPRRRWGRRRP